VTIGSDGGLRRACDTNGSDLYQVTSTTDSQGHDTTVNYDSVGRPTVTTNALPTDNTVATAYNADGTPANSYTAGPLSQCTAPAKRCTTYTYTWNSGGGGRTTINKHHFGTKDHLAAQVDAQVLARFTAAMTVDVSAPDDAATESRGVVGFEV